MNKTKISEIQSAAGLKGGGMKGWQETIYSPPLFYAVEYSQLSLLAFSFIITGHSLFYSDVHKQLEAICMRRRIYLQL